MCGDVASTFCIGVEFKPTGGLLFSNVYCSLSYSALINIQPTPPLAPLVRTLSRFGFCGHHEGHPVPLIFTENPWTGIKPQ